MKKSCFTVLSSGGWRTLQTVGLRTSLYKETIYTYNLPQMMLFVKMGRNKYPVFCQKQKIFGNMHKKECRKLCNPTKKSPPAEAGGDESIVFRIIGSR